MADNVVLSSNSTAVATVNDDEAATLKTTVTLPTPQESNSRADPSSKSGVDFLALMRGPKSLVNYDIDLFTAILDGRGINQSTATAKVAAFRKAADDFRNELNKIRNPW